tara:strand:+ start:590 stop:757 length:168 start_codon:yes stop_codon:yes gene_type:complete
MNKNNSRTGCIFYGVEGGFSPSQKYFTSLRNGQEVPKRQVWDRPTHHFSGFAGAW